ncbi:16S rRNA processing protein RimM [hydrothermal vent metagenome]|uniref:16S rRNA processing protein RimM n=1 Tax=hydrothermal vent metagenome TaxID=652676 RepID=A0A3B1B591_9ZZZZ
MADDSGLVILGRVSGVYGVKGWVRVYSDTSPRTNILNYPTWYLRRADDWEQHELRSGRAQGKGLVAQLVGCDDRDQAAELIQADIAIRHEQLPKLKADEFYWSELEGLRVQTMDGMDLGVVDHLLETGANDVVVVKGERERLIPYLWQDVIRSVDLETGLMTVDWDPEF